MKRKLSKQLTNAVTARLRGQKIQLPEAGLLLWSTFQSLSGTRTYNLGGPNPIQPSEIAAWCQLHRLPLAPHHVDILLAMDQVWLDHAYAKARTPESVKRLPLISAHPISAVLLDAVLG